MCRLLGVSKQAYYKHEDHLMKRLALESFVVEFSKEAVMPGKQGTVTVIFDGNEQPAGHFNKSVRVRFNSEHLHNLRIKGVMEGE